MTHSVEQAVAQIERFYCNYQSQRYVQGALVLRVLRLPPKRALTKMAREFSDILDQPRIRVVQPSPLERSEGDALDCGRIALGFNHRSNGRLRHLIDAINEY